MTLTFYIYNIPTAVDFAFSDHLIESTIFINLKDSNHYILLLYVKTQSD